MLVETPTCSQIFLRDERCGSYLLTLKSDSISKVSIIFVAFHASSNFSDMTDFNASAPTAGDKLEGFSFMNLTTAL